MGTFRGKAAWARILFQTLRCTEWQTQDLTPGPTNSQARALIHSLPLLLTFLCPVSLFWKEHAWAAGQIQMLSLICSVTADGSLEFPVAP